MKVLKIVLHICLFPIFGQRRGTSRGGAHWTRDAALEGAAASASDDGAVEGGSAIRDAIGLTYTFLLWAGGASGGLGYSQPSAPNSMAPWGGDTFRA